MPADSGCWPSVARSRSYPAFYGCHPWWSNGIIRQNMILLIIMTSVMTPVTLGPGHQQRHDRITSWQHSWVLMTVSYSIYHTTRLWRTTQHSNNHNNHNASFLLCLFVFLVTDVSNASISTPIAYCVDTIRLKIPIEIFVIFSNFQCQCRCAVRSSAAALLRPEIMSTSTPRVAAVTPQTALRPASRQSPATLQNTPQEILNGDISPFHQAPSRAAESDILCNKQ